MSWYINEKRGYDGNVDAFEVGHYAPDDRHDMPDLKFDVLRRFSIEDGLYSDLSWEKKEEIAFNRAASFASFLNGGPTPPEDSHWRQ